MNNICKIAIIGLGQVGNYLYRELNLKKKDIEIKTGKKIKIVAISAKNINKKRKYEINKNIFYSDTTKIIKKIKPDILFEVIGLSDGISKKIVESALKNKIHVITPNKALISKHGDYLAKLAEDTMLTCNLRLLLLVVFQLSELLRKVWQQTKFLKFMEF